MRAKSLTPDKYVFLVIDAYGGKISGKTLLQKRCYFISTLMGLDLDYRPHYFGPYSPDVDEGLSKNKSLGFIEEHTYGYGKADPVGFEIRRYDYSITDDGKEIVSHLKRLFPEEAKQIRKFKRRLIQAGDSGDYISLSIAAKTYFIVKRRNAPVTVDEIQEEAGRLGWNIHEKSIDKAVDFLEELGLATRN